MAPETKWEQRAKLSEKAKLAYEASDAAMALAFECEAAMSRLDGETAAAEFNDALAECYRTHHTEAATAAKDEAYARLVAARAVLDSGRTLEVP